MKYLVLALNAFLLLMMLLLLQEHGMPSGTLEAYMVALGVLAPCFTLPFIYLNCWGPTLVGLWLKRKSLEEKTRIAALEQPDAPTRHSNGQRERG